MKILVLMKRFGANKDMPVQNFGRQIRLFENLAAHHKIDFLCMDFKRSRSENKSESKSRIIERGGINYYIFGLCKLQKKIRFLIKKNRYDIIFASTSPLLGIIAYFYSRVYKIPMLYDLMDNFSAYSEYRIPLIGLMDKYATKHCEGVICVSESLREKISSFRKKPIYVISNGFRADLFKEVDKKKARKKLNLPLKSNIIGYIGNFEKIKGADILLGAFKKVRESYPDTYLLLCGKIEKNIGLSQKSIKNIILRDYSDEKDVALSINSIDVAVIPNNENDFSKYCFPYKLAEYMACRVPIVATGVGDVSLVLKDYHGSLCSPNPNDLADKILLKFKRYQRVDYGKELGKLDWRILSEKLNIVLTKFID